MVKAPDFDRKMLLLATQLANDTEMKRLLLSVLEALLETVGSGDNSDSHTEAITLIRCIIRLVLKLMDEPDANRYAMVHSDHASTDPISFHIAPCLYLS